jgi:hypothetical protein
MPDPVWDDPTIYDPMKHGPPYLPDVRTAMQTKNASVKAMINRVSNELVNEAQAMLESMTGDYGHSKMAELAALVAYLRGLAMVHQTHHWQTRGCAYYGDHLLFERLYGNVSGEVDSVAEKAVGTGQHLLVQPIMQTAHLGQVIKCLYRGAPVDPEPTGYVALSLRAELCFMVFLQLVYARLQASGGLSLGIDNQLQGIADKHEENLYLLRQRMGSRQASLPKPDAWKAT